MNLDRRPDEDADMRDRIAKRRKKLEEKLKAAKRQAAGEAGNATSAASHLGSEQRESKGEAQIAQSRARLAQLKTAARDATTRYRVVTDQVEGRRRTREEALAIARDAKIEDNVQSSHTDHGNIQMSLDSLFELNPDKQTVPQELMRDLNAQRDECAKVIELKDDLIDELRRQMVDKEGQYVTSLKLQADDIDTLIGRMHEYTEQLVQAYQAELSNIEDAYVQERREVIDSNDQEIQALIQQREERERDHKAKREQRILEDQKKLDDRYDEEAEKYNKSKMDNLKDIHELQQELASVQARFMLNQEKLHYNLRVLNERVNENKKAMDLHRKKLGRLQDVLSTLLAKYHETERKYHGTNRELTEGYRRVTEQYKDLQLKFQHFEKADAEKYQQVWKMHEEDCMKLVHKCLQGDRVVFEEMLGVRWSAPSLDFWLADSDVDASADTMQGSSGADQQTAAVADGMPEIVSDLEENDQMMLQIIYAQVPFLVDDKVRRMVDQVDDQDAQYRKIEAVLSALQIKTADDARAMINNYFVVNAEDGQPAMINPQEVVRALKRYLRDRAANAAENGSSLKIDLNKLETQKMESMKKDAEAKQRIRQREFWTRMTNVVPDPHTRLWTSVERAMGMYLKQLQKRQEMIQSTDALRAQNDELRALLNNYLSSGVNDELFSPPQLQVAGGPAR